MSTAGDAPFGALPVAAFGWAGAGAAPPRQARRFASAEYVGSAGASPLVYGARVLGGVEIGQSVADALGVGGRVALTVGEIELDNSDGALDAVSRFDLAAGGRVVLRAVPVASRAASDFGTPLASADILFHGEAAALAALGPVARLAVTDRLERLNTRLQAVLYGGGGALDGPPELAGRPKPMSFGFRFNVSPVQLGLVDFGDGPLPTFQTNWRGVARHDEVRERGTPARKVERRPGVGEWRDWPQWGCFQIGFTPDGHIACDTQGDAPGGPDTYVSSTGRVLRRLLTAPGPALADADMDAAAWDAFEAAMPGTIGWGTDGAEVTAMQAAEQVLGAAGAWLAGNRDGTVAPAVVGAPAATPRFTLEDADLVAHAWEAPPASLSPTPAAVEVGWRRNWSPGGDLRPSVQGQARDDLSSPGRVARSLSNAVAGRGGPFRAYALPGLYMFEEDARARADKLRGWIERGLRVREFTTDRFRNRIGLGMTGRYAGGRYGPAWSGVVVGWSERVPACRVRIRMMG